MNNKLFNSINANVSTAGLTMNEGFEQYSAIENNCNSHIGTLRLIDSPLF